MAENETVDQIAAEEQAPATSAQADGAGEEQKPEGSEEQKTE